MNGLLRWLTMCALVLVLSVSPVLASQVAIVGVSLQQARLDDVEAKIAAVSSFSVLDTYRIDGSTLDPALLAQYDAVLFYTDAGVGNPAAIGDVLADYVDAGGGLVVAMTAYHGGQFGLGGRIVNEGYLPFTIAPFAQGVQRTLEALDAAHPLLFRVEHFDGGTRSDHHQSAFVPAATPVAQWSNDGGPQIPLVGLLAPSGAGMVVGLNMYPPSGDAFANSWDPQSDGARLMANALAYAAEPGLRSVMRNQLIADRLDQHQAALEAFCSGTERRPNVDFYGRLCPQR